MADGASTQHQLIRRLRDDLHAAGYDAAGISSAVGEEALAAAQRGVFTPARLRCKGADPEHAALVTLIRLFKLGETLPVQAVAAALPSLTSAGAESLGLLSRTDSDEFRAALSLNPEITGGGDTRREWLIISDLDDHLRRGPARPDHVMGVGGATRSLIAQAPPLASGRALDLGTGCGIVALHLSTVTPGEIVATDVSERALNLARLNAVLNEVDRIDFRLGSLFEPVAGETFDMILSNPPFVITPRLPDGPVLEYRDGGLMGDELAAAVVRGAPAHLAVGGTLLCLANWETLAGSSGLDRVRGWIEADSEPDISLSAWVMERDVVSPERYAETWARDGGARPGTDGFEQLMLDWLTDFAARGVRAIGLGSIRIRRDEGSPTSRVRVEQATGPFSPDPGPALEDAFRQGVGCARLNDADVLLTRWLRDPGVTEVREYRPGEEEPSGINLVVERGVYRRIHADTVLAGAIGACDGDLTLGQIADALASILELDPQAVREALVDGVRELTFLGMIVPFPQPVE